MSMARTNHMAMADLIFAVVSSAQGMLGAMGSRTACSIRVCLPMAYSMASAHSAIRVGSST